MDSDSEVEDDKIPSWKGVSGTTILINAFDPLKLNAPSKSFEATFEMVRNSLRMSTSQLIGVSLYSTNVTNLSSSGIEGVFQVFPLKVPNLDDLKQLQNTNIETCGQAKELKMSDVLWYASKIFSNCKRLLATKTIIILTRLDVPPIEADQKPTLKRVVDLVDTGIQLKIINVAENIYHIDKFYENFLMEINKCNEFDLPKPVWNKSDISKLMHHYSHRHVAVARLSFEISEGLAIGVGVYSLLKSNLKPKKVKEDKESNQIVTSVTTNLKVTYNCDDNMEEDEVLSKEVPLLKSEMLYYQMFGAERVEFTHDEMKQIRNPFGPPTMKLLGFKPANILCKEKWFFKRCDFLFPSESVIEGSTIAFKALHRACTEMSVIAVCVLCTRVNSKPQIVALSPCIQPLGLDIKIGFDIIYIPFIENIINVPNIEDTENNIDEAHMLVLKDIVTGLKFNYRPDMFENPSLKSLYNAIEALALDKENDENFEDTTKCHSMNFKNIDAELFEEIFGPFGISATKRPPAQTSNVPGGKKERLENIDENLLQTRLASHQVDKYTVEQLKHILKLKSTKKLPALTGLKKHELVTMVYSNVVEQD